MEGCKVEPAAGKDKTLGEHIREVGSPAARLIGFEVPESGGGRAVVTLQAGPQHANPMGTIHGGILCDIADAARGIALSSTLEPGETFPTVELKINFLRPVRERKLSGEKDTAGSGNLSSYELSGAEIKPRSLARRPACRKKRAARVRMTRAF